jgi:2-polyprenyl-6-methoxyphenol hydroxylase-like FAD-dependent oxidoreductase
VGFDALVLEASPRMLALGAVLQLWPHGVQVLDQVGVGESIRSEGGQMQGLEFLTSKGRRLLRIDWGTADTIAISRARLHEILADAVGIDAIRLGSAVTGFEQDDSGVTAHLADGSVERGAVLVGAEGLKSKIRDQLVGPVEERYVGQGWGGLVSIDDTTVPVGDTWNIFGPGARAGFLHVKPGVLGWNTLLNVPEDEDVGGKEEALERFRGWPTPLERTLEAVPPEAFFIRPIKDFAPVEKWGEGRVTLLGDAIHPTTPAQGRGISECMESAHVLAKELARAVNLSDSARTAAALRAYEAKRRPQTATVTEASIKIMRMGTLKNPIASFGRNTFFRVAGPFLSKKMTEDIHRTVEPL